MTFAKSDEGQFYLQVLSEFGITPAQWRDMDPRDASFLFASISERNRRENERIKRAEAERKVRRR